MHKSAWVEKYLRRSGPGVGVAIRLPTFLPQAPAAPPAGFPGMGDLLASKLPTSWFAACGRSLIQGREAARCARG